MEWKQLINPILWVMAPIVALAYLIIPLTNDARIYLGVEHIAASYYPFPQGIDLAWEIKPIANRLTNYILYKIATLFVPFEDHYLFGIAVKVLILIVIITIAYYFSRRVPVPYAFFLIFYTFTTMANFCVLQAEYWAALCAVLAIAMLQSHMKEVLFAAGALAVWIFLLKGITGLLVIPILCGAYLLFIYLDPHVTVFTILAGRWNMALLKRIDLLIAGFVSAAAIFVCLWLTIWPNMVSDMLLSPQLARVGQVGPVNLIVWFFAQLVLSPLYIPVLLIGIAFGAIFFFAWVRHQDTDIRVAYELMWIVPAVIVIAQGEMFLYHYLAFVPAAVVTVVMCEVVSG